MADNPYVSANNIIDTDLGKKYELLHQRAFPNVSVSTGWKPSDDGLFNYYKDINLTIQKGEEPITLVYSPFVIVPQNANKSCKPSNFPYAKTVKNNTVRLYAYDIPDPTAMLPVTITMMAVGSSDGSTNAGGGLGNGGGDITIDKTFLQVRGTSFLAPIDGDLLTTEKVTIEMKMNAYQGQTKKKTTIGNLDTVDVFFNSDGTAINTKDNNIEIKTLNGAADDVDACVFWATIPKGVKLKDRLAYFVVPVSAGNNFFARATLLTSRGDDLVSKITRYEIFSPLLSRSTTNNYYADGKVVGPEGIRFIAKGFTANGTSSDARGNIVFYNADNDDLILRSALTSGSIDVTDPTIFNGVNNLKIDLEVEGSVVETKITEIATSVKDIIIQTSSEYVVPLLEGESYKVPAIDVRLLIQSSLNYIEPIYGRVVVKDEEGLIVLDSLTQVTTVTIPSKSYDSAGLPSYYKIEMTMPGETTPRSSRFVSILKKGETVSPIVLDVTPTAVIILADKDGVIPAGGDHKFKARVLKGISDVSDDWVFKHTIASGAVSITQNKNVFNITAMESASAVVNVTATMGADVLTQQITLTKISQSDSNGNFTFIKYGNKVQETEGGEFKYEFTIDPEGVLPPGTVIGDYYGIVTTSVDEAPSDSNLYIWTAVDSDDNIDIGEQIPPMGSFAIEGDTVVSAILNGDGRLSFYPQFGEYSIVALGELEPLVTDWQYKINGVWTDFDGYQPEAGVITLEYENLPLSKNNSISIRAKVKTIVEAELKEFYAHSNIYILYNDKPQYFGQVRVVGGDSSYSHSFPIDRFGTAINGTRYSKNPVYLTVDMYKGTNLLDMDENNEEYFEIVNINGAGSSMSYTIVNNQLSAMFDSIQGQSGTVEITVLTSTGLQFDLPFSWTTRNIQEHIKSSISAIASNTDFIIDGATLSEISNWNASIANSTHIVESLLENDPIEIIFDTTNTNIENISITNASNNSLININPSLVYAGLGKLGKLSPIGPIEGKDDEGLYFGDLLAGHYYLVVSRKNENTPRLKLYNEDILMEEIEMPEDYDFLGSNAMVIKPVSGVNQFTYEDLSDFVPYFFKFTPIAELMEIVSDDEYFDGSKLDMGRVPSSVADISSLLPTDYLPIQNVPYSYEISEDGRGFMRLMPSLAIYEPNFANKFANENITIKIDSSTGEATQLSIHRRVYPNKELGNIGNDIKNIFNGEYFDQSGINTLKASRTLVKADRESMMKLITELDVEAIEPEMPPLEVKATYFYEEIEENGEFVYNVDTTRPIPPIDGVDIETIFGFVLYDNAFYYLTFDLDAESEFEATFVLKNKANGSVIGQSQTYVVNGRTKIEFVLPRANAQTIPSLVKDYIVEKGLSNTTNIPSPFMDKPSVVGEFAPFYLHMKVDENAPSIVRVINPATWELRPEYKVRSNIYSSLEGTGVYNSMLEDTVVFLLAANEIVSLYEVKDSEGNSPKIPTSDFSQIFNQFEKAKVSIEDLKNEMDIVARKESIESIFQQSTTSRSHIFGYSSSEGYLSSFEITPQGTIIKGDKNQIIGSTSIGSLYGKKLVIGKEITPEDMKKDEEYRIDTKGREGIIAVWDSVENVWSSSMDKNGQFFMRYRKGEIGNSLIGYMVMNSKEIAAYDFPPITEGLGDHLPIDVNSQHNKTAIFSINDNGTVYINQLVVKDATGRKATVDLMDTVRITKYTSSDNKRSGIVFIGIGGK